ncbi:MAG: pyridoxamine 5'-phosphate oxidase [Phyllobacteriaceae bacterium]|nr:pyridoxamine 5'-phosphate oxidase [Phyllobacteriaceae bacterium]
MTEPDAFSPVETARRLVREARTAALATLARRTGHPFGSMVSVACEPDGTPILLMSTLAAHSRNLAEDPRASLLYVDPAAPDPQRGARLTVVGRVEKIAAPADAARRYLARLPEAALYAGFADFAFFRLVVEDAHLVAGFGRAMRVRGEDLLLAIDEGATLPAAEADLLARLDADRPRVAAWAARLGAPAGEPHLVGLDPEGMDLMIASDESRTYLRIVLPQSSVDPATFEATLRHWEESVPLQ